MDTPESKVKHKVKALLKKYGCYQHWPVQIGYGSACLDCHGAHSGLYFAIETKAPGNHPTPRQLLTIEEIEAAGGKVFVIGEKLVDGVYSGMGELEEWLQNESQ